VCSAGRLFGKVVRQLVGRKVVKVACGWGCTLVITEDSVENAASRDSALVEVPEVGDMMGHGVELPRYLTSSDSPSSPPGTHLSAAMRCDTPIVTELGLLGTLQTGPLSPGRDCRTQPSSTLRSARGGAVSSGNEADASRQDTRAHALLQQVWLPGRGSETGRVQELVATILDSRFLDGIRYYQVAVRYHNFSWVVERRYRQFRDMHVALLGMTPSRFWEPSSHTCAASATTKGSSKVGGLPPFPPRALRLKFEAAGNREAAEARLQALQLYLDGIGQLDGIMSNKAVQLFFDVSARRVRDAEQAAAARALLQARAPAEVSILRECPDTSNIPDAHGRSLLPPVARGWSLSSFDSVRSRPRLGDSEHSGQTQSSTQGRDECKAGSESDRSCHSDSEVSCRAGSSDRNCEQSWSISVRSPTDDRAQRGPHDPPQIVHTDASMWENYGYWVQEVAPHWEATMRQSQKKKQAQSLVCSEGVSAFARGVLWPLSIGNMLQLNRDLYGILKDKAHSARASSSSLLLSFGLESTAELIETDLSRTMSHLSLFDEAGPYGQELRDVLEAYCFYRPDVGYVQGMSYPAAILVMHCLDDYTAFSCLANVVSRPLFQCFFRPNDAFKAACLKERLGILDTMLKANLPALHRHLQQCGVTCEIYARTWFITLFARNLPLPMVARIWDLYLVQGEVLLYKTAIAVLRLLKSKLLAMDDDEVLRLLLGDLSDALPPEQHKLFEAIEASRMTQKVSSALDTLFARESVHEFKSTQNV